MKKQALFIVLMFMPLMASAQTKINGIYYWLNSTNKVAEVTKVPSGTTKYSGSITIPKAVTYGGETYSVTSIGNEAFRSCSSLTSITIPNSVSSIGWFAFYGCSSLKSVNVSDIAAWCDISFSEYDSNPLNYSHHLFLNGVEVKELIIPNSVTYIGSYAFSGCSNLSSVTIPSSMTRIDNYAFSGCSGLESVQIDDISAWCKIQFGYYCYEEGMIECESNPLLYAKHLYLNGEEVNNLIIPENVLKISNCAFVGFNGESVSIPNSVTSIEVGAFYGCSGLTSVNIPNSVTNIGNWAFGYSRGLTSFVIPNSVTSIGYYAFSGCSDLTSITIGNSVTSIAEGTFSGCSDLTSITIGNSVTSIEYGAFSGCSGLKSVYVSDIAAWCGITFTTYLSNPLYYAHQLFLNEVEVKDLIIPNGVTSIAEGAFSGCSGLTSVTIPNSVTSIGYDAFSGCSGLTSVTIPNSVTSIGNSTFSGCSSLTSITIPNSVTSIESSTFSGCSGLTSVTIPNSVTSIGNNAFQGCSKLSSVSIGKGIKSVGTKAFANCPEIKEVYCYAKDVPTISNDTFENSYYIKWATLYVPESSVDLYKASAWSQFGNIVGITGGNEGERCAKPVITLLANGKIKVESSTEGATCVTNITASNAESLTDGEISLNTPLNVYTVTAYATKEGYDDSEVATATFRYEKTEGDMNGDGQVNVSDVVQLVNTILSK